MGPNNTPPVHPKLPLHHKILDYKREAYNPQCFRLL